MKKILLFLIIFVLFSTIDSVKAAVFNVTNYTEFWNALDSAGDNGEDDVINLAAGTYAITWPLTYFASANPEENFQLTIQGAGAGVTVLDGAGAYKILTVTTNYNGLAVDDRSHITIRNLAFFHGYESQGPDLNGGALAVYAEYANIVLENCVFTNNYAAQDGGGAYLATSYGAVSVTNCVFVNNSAVKKGGGAYLSSIYGAITTTNNTFTQNSTEDPNGPGGGGLYMYGKTPTLTDNVFENNQGGYYGMGGGAYIWAPNVSNSVVSLTNNSFNDNSTGGIGSGFGGGVYIYNEGIQTTLTNNTFSGNNAPYGPGGGAHLHVNNINESSSTNLTGNKFTNNSADSGGGFWVESSGYLTLTATNNVSKNNTSEIRGAGGCIQLSPSYQNELSFINNTIVNNQAVNNYQVTTEGGGLYIDSGNGTVDFYNNIIWGNISAKGKDLYLHDSSAPTINLFYNDFSDFHNFCQDNECSEVPTINNGDNIDSNPRLAADFRLLQTSPCINSGNNNAPNLPPLDFEGEPRIAGGTVDIGADESPYMERKVISQSDFDGDGKTDIAFYRASTGVWWISPSAGAPAYGYGWGGPGFKPVPGDYDGDTKTDIAIYDTTGGAWWIIPSSGIPAYGVGWGGSGFTPIHADYDGDTKTDIAIYDTTGGAWWIIPSSGVGPQGQVGAYGVGWGGPGFKPVLGDYDGDGNTDIAIYDTTGGAWWIIPSSGIPAYGVGWGGAAFKPVPGDYDGDGKTDIAIYNTTHGGWWIVPSSGTGPQGQAGAYGVGWGGSEFTPVPGDYDGDGKTDVAIYQPGNGGWWMIYSSDGSTYGMGWGGDASDVPLTTNPD